MSNWLSEEISKVDPSQDLIVFENPEIKVFLDDILMELWEGFRYDLEEAGYNSVTECPEIKSKPYPSDLTRYFEFMLFDEDCFFFRGTLSCSRDHWMIEFENHIGLSNENDPNVVFELLGNTRFAGSPPEMTVSKRDSGDYFQIVFRNGFGAGWGLKDKNQAIVDVRKVINVNIKMHELALSGVISKENLGKFISTAYDVYESY